MALDVASWCKQFEVIAFLLIFVSSSVTSCPQDCKCGDNFGKKFAACMDLNNLTRIPTGFPADTVMLILYRNQILRIQQNAFPGLSNLERISIQFNPLTTIEGNAFQGLTKIDELALPRNNITLVHKDSFKGLTKIGRIDLSRNNLQTLPEGLFEDTVSLERLILHRNKISSISSSLFTRLGNLSHLELKYNRLTQFPLEPIKNLTGLSLLLLEGNLFTTIPSEAKEIFDRIAQKQGATIRISRNPLVCTKELKWLQTWMKLHPLVIEVDRITCQTPFGNQSKVIDFDFSLLDTLPKPGDINAPMTSPTPSITSPSAVKLAATSSTALLTSTTVTALVTSSATPTTTSSAASSATPTATSSAASSVTTSATSSSKSTIIAPTSSSTSHSASSTIVVTNLPETTRTTEKEIPSETSDTVTPGSKVDVSTKSIEQESGSQKKFFTRSQEVILTASLVGICLIVIVAVALYFFRKKVLLRQKALTARLPGMMYDRVNSV